MKRIALSLLALPLAISGLFATPDVAQASQSGNFGEYKIKINATNAEKEDEPTEPGYGEPARDGEGGRAERAVGSPLYISPEAASGQATDHRTVQAQIGQLAVRQF